MFFFNCCMRRESSLPDYQKEDILQRINFVWFHKMGYGPEKDDCQDSYCGVQSLMSNCHFFAIYDGHGVFGKQASQATNDYMQTFLEKNRNEIQLATNDQKRIEFLETAFRQTELKLLKQDFDYSRSGTCVLCTLIINSTLYIANLGDSKIVLYKTTQNENKAIQLSIDHTTKNENEKQRILNAGGLIEEVIKEVEPIGPKRVWGTNKDGPGFVCTRSFGDTDYKKLLISEPEISKYDLTREDKFIILGSDSVWDVMTIEEACEFFDSMDQDDQTAELFIHQCRDRWDQKSKVNHKSIGDCPKMSNGCDDLSVIVVYFTYYDESPDEQTQKQ